MLEVVQQLASRVLAEQMLAKRGDTVTNVRRESHDSRTVRVRTPIVTDQSEKLAQCEAVPQL